MSERRKLIWRCRRGMREMDILLLEYLQNHYDNASTEEQNAFEELLEETDLDILSWVMARTSPDEKYMKLIAFIRESATKPGNTPHNQARKLILMSPIWKDYLSSRGAEFKDDRLPNFTNNKINDSTTVSDIVADLSHLAIIEVSGDDAENFLHGQFTIDVKALSNMHCQFSAWCNPKGQVKTTFLIYRNDNNFIILLPAELKDSFLKQLQMFVLRANVNLADKSDELIRIGVQTKDEMMPFNLINSVPKQADDLHQGKILMRESLHCLRILSAKGLYRFIITGTVARQMDVWKELAKQFTPVGTSLWELLDVQAACPWITTETTQKFLPQMLNLDLINGLNYQKGCYPGQEIITRLHFRGQLKRSLCLATTTLDSQAISGVQLYVENSENCIGTVINAQAVNDKYYLLAVIDIDAREKKISLGNTDGSCLHLLQLPY